MIFPVDMHRFRTVSLLLVPIISTVVGCNNGDQPQLGQVVGIVTLDGKPLSGVSVLFQPSDGRPAMGTTDSAGKYELTYIGQTKGTKVGPNRVEIASSEEGEESGEIDSGDGEPQADLKKSNRSGKPAVPARYNVQSELNVDVKPGENTFDFQLKSK